MNICGSDQIRCSLVQDHSKHDSINYVLSRLDGTLVEEAEIGQDDWKYRYPKEKKFFTWKFLDHTPDMRAKVQLRAMQEAYNSVQKITELTLDYEKDINKKTDMTVEWIENIQTFDDRLSVLAHAYLYFPNSKKNGVMEFNDSPESKWYFTPLGWPVEAYLVDPINYTKGQSNVGGGLSMLASQSTVKIAMHELGHILGLRHDIINKSSMMYPSVSRSYIGNKIQKKTFHWDSITSIPRLTESYGSSGIIERILERWRGRRTRKTTYTRYNKSN